jgi:type IV pilus assembly protein PilV
MGLIEVLVAVAVLAFGLLGIAAMQATTLRNSQSASERSEAVIATDSILERMRANISAARIGRYNIPKTCSVPVAGDLVANDLHDWIQGLQDRFGTGACGTIDCGSIECTVTVTWDDSRGTAGATEQQVLTETRL